MKKKKMKSRIFVAVVVLLVVAIGVIAYGAKLLNDAKTKIAEQADTISSNEQDVYVAKGFIPKGTMITDQGDEANVVKQQIVTGLESYNYLDESELGNIAIVDIDDQMPILSNATTPLEIAADTREYEIAAANLMTDQNENDYIDVRILFPNGEDYLVLAKKQVKNLNIESNVFYSYCNEEEILRTSAAIVDAYMTTGARIYTTRYVESNIQEAAKPNYPVRPETIDLIKNDPNVLTNAVETLNLSARLDLEQRLGNMKEDKLTAVSAGFGLTDTAKNSVMMGSNDASLTAEDAATGETAETTESAENTDTAESAETTAETDGGNAK